MPVALAAIPLVLTRISEATGPGGAVGLPGLVLVAAAALGLVWGLVQGNTAGWGSTEVIGPLAGGAGAAVALAAWERRTTRPMLPMRLFRSAAFSAGNAAIFAINASLTGGAETPRFVCARFAYQASDHAGRGRAVPSLRQGLRELRRA